MFSHKLKPKDLIGMPWRLAFALQADGWWLRSAITWCKKSCMPESVTDRPTTATEMIFLLSKSATYFYDADAVREKGTGKKWNSADMQNSGSKDAAAVAQGLRTRGGTSFHPDEDRTGRNLRNWWPLGHEPFPEAHFATFPSEIPWRAILAGTSAHGCCATCGTPCERVVESGEIVPLRGNSTAGPKASVGDRHGRMASGYAESGWVPGFRERATTGWRPTCAHGGEPAPCTVLDPFVGSGTTGIVAAKLGRDFIGIDLSEEYCAMARRRIAGAAPLFAEEKK